MELHMLESWGVKAEVDGVRIVSATGQVSGLVSSVADDGVVSDDQGARFVLRGAPVPSLSSNASSKLLASLASGFGKAWARAVNAERKRLRQIDEMKEVDWRALPFVGIEFSAIESIYAQPFAFPHLVRELQRGELSNRPYPIYIFQGAQPCWSDAEQTMRNVPYLVAVDCAVAPPDKLVYHTLQLARHDVVDMKAQPAFARYEWTPYVPEAIRAQGGYEKTPVQVYTLAWAGRGAQYSNIGEADLHRIEFLHPYILLPQIVEKMEAPVVTCVDFEWEYAGKKYQVVFDKEIDRLATYLPEFVEDHNLTAEAEEPLKEALQNAFKQKRAKEEAGYRAMIDEVAAMTPETQSALRGMRAFKFYPFHPTLSIAPFVEDSINPYFGKATKVFLPSEEDAQLLRQEYEIMQQQQAASTTPGRRAARGTPKRGRDETTAALPDQPADDSKKPKQTDEAAPGQ